jgi:plastocyanin
MAARTESNRPHLHRALAGLAAAAVLGLGLAACGGGDDVSAGSGDASTTTTAADSGGAYGGGGGGASDETYIEAKDFSLTSITVAPGADVEVQNDGKATHTVTADDGAFDAGQVAPGSTATFTAPAEPGDYGYHCKIHPSMTGTLTVEG